MEPERIDTRQVLTAGAAVLLVECLLYAAATRWPEKLMALTGAARALQIILTALLAGRTGLSNAAALGLTKSSLFHGTVRGLFWSAGFGALCAGAAFILYAIGFNAVGLLSMQMPGSRGEILWLFAVGALISPVAEEIFFRGLIYGFFRRWGAAAAITGSTVLFAAAHLPIASLPLTQIVGGLLFAVAYERERSLTTPITIHVLGNTAIFSLSLWF
jgi:uncharacterized protein